MRVAATWPTNGVLLKRRLIVTNDLKNDSAVVAAEEAICERINIESTKKLKTTEW